MSNIVIVKGNYMRMHHLSLVPNGMSHHILCL